MRLSCLITAGIALFSASAPAFAQQFDPHYRFRVIPTDHFVIYFHQGEDAMAQRLARIAEETWQALRAPLGRRAPDRTHVILVDQTDVANGWATPVPRNTMAIYAVWPSASDSLNSDDWLRLAFTHEYTHILHLDRSEGWARAARGLFGRIPFAFPNLFLPGWQIEGLAVYEESRVTGEGRMHAGDFRAVVGEAARAQQLLPLDRANGGLTRWPSGQAPYAYGLGFHAYLADRYGVNTLTELADRTARSLPYFGSLAFKRVYGKDLGTLWREYHDAAIVAVEPAPAWPAAQRLTRHNYVVTGPRFRSSDIYYSVRNADELPSVYRLSGASASAPERVTSRILGSTLAPGRDRVYFDQQESRRNAGLYSDLYSLDPVSGRVRALTREARVMDPDISPDQQSIVAVKVRPGARDLVLVRLASPDEVAAISTLVSEPDTQFNAPRWSPDGKTIVVGRQRLGASPEIVVVDVESTAVCSIASGARARWATPTWRPDGGAVVAAASIDDGPFNLFEIDPATAAIRQLTHTTGGATWPVVSPDGQSIVYAGYTATGFDLFRVPYAPDTANPTTAGLQNPRTLEPQNPGTPEPATRQASIYRPWPTLPPTSWSPVIDRTNDVWRVGAGVAGVDVLGYHAYSAEITTLTGAPSAAPSARLNWDLTYVYGRWRPGVFAAASRETRYVGVSLQDTADILNASREQTEAEIGVFVPVLHARVSQVAVASFLRGSARLTTASGEQSLDRAAARFAWSFRSAHQFGRSISFERGVVAGVTTELVRRALGSTADATTMTADARVYGPGLARHHVLAVRAAGGATTGDRAVGRTFFLGGAGSNGSPIDFGAGAISLLRGFQTDAFAGTHVALVNADYRFPLLQIERGAGTLPIFLHTIHGSIFADAGQVWTRRFSAGSLKTSFGGEIAARLVVGYGLNVSVAAGVARGHDGAGRVPDQTTWFARAGYAF
jgi:hypothetical protein